MLAESIAYRNVYIICGYTDMRKSINGLVAILTQQYQIKSDAESLYLFCGKKADRMKAILWEEDGFLLLYKVLTGYKFQWPRTAAEVRQLTRTQYSRLLEGLEIEKKVFSPPKEFF
jgi:transposase